MKTKEFKPIKRHNALVQFSREHHFGLLLVWKIREGIKNGIDPERIGRYTLCFFDRELRPHFLEEENFFFGKLPEDDPLVLQALKEHKSISIIIDELSRDNNNMQILMNFASLLEDHIRFEERVLFNHLQNILSNDELRKTVKQQNQKTCNADDEWKDKFWENNKRSGGGSVQKLAAGLTLMISFCFFMGCSTNEKTENNKPEEHETSMVHSEDSSVSLSLNDGRKWKADSITNINVAVIENIVSTSHPETTDEFHAIGIEIQGAVNKLLQDCKMHGPDHEALHHWLEPILETNNKLSESRTMDETKENFGKMRDRILIYHQYFE